MIRATSGLECRIKPAQPGEGRSIARMLRLSLPRHLRRFTIWASPEAGHYVEALLTGAFPEQRLEHYVLRCGSRMAGLAVFRDLQGQAFLNHLYISPEWRGRSLGARLLAQAARRYLESRPDLERHPDVERHPARQMALDVMAGSHPAEAWYERLGFREAGRRGWWLAQRLTQRASARRDPAHPSTPNFRIEAIRNDEGWGFHQFVCVLPGGRRYEVGSLYGPYFRLGGLRAAGDSELHQALASLDPERRLLLVAPGDFSGSNWRCIAVSRRLAGNANSLLDRLETPAGAEVAHRRKAAFPATLPAGAGEANWGARFRRHAEVMPSV